MIRYRTFLNTDAPALVELWNSQAGRRALAQPMTLNLLEECIFAKPYFDRHGFLVAKDDDHLVGFAHAGFGAGVDGLMVSTEVGAVNLVVVAEHPQRETTARELLAQGESYLIGGGARTLWAGCMQPAHGFYLGLYGGSESPGVLESDADSLALFRSAGYAEVEQHAILQRRLASFRPPIDRKKVQLRREYHVESEANPPPASWWEAWTMEPFDRIRHRLFKRGGGDACGSVMIRCWERLSGNSDAGAMAVEDLHIPAELRRQGLGVFLLGEVLRCAQGNGVTLAEVQVAQSNPQTLALLKKLGFQQVDRGWGLRKNL